MTTGWIETLLGEILTERKETPTSESLDSGEVNIVSKIGFNKGKIELRSDGKTKTGMILIRPGDLVISGINATKGAIAIYNDKQNKPIAATIHYSAYTPNKERVDVNYLWWFLRSNAFKDIVQHHIPGGIKTELKSKRFLAVPIPLPPLIVQKQILSRIELLAEKIHVANNLRKITKEEVKFFEMSLIKFVCEGKLKTQDAKDESAEKMLRRHGRTPLQDSTLPLLPDGWCWATLESVASTRKHAISSGPFGSALGTKDYIERGVPVIRGQNIKNGNFLLDNLVYVSDEKANALIRSTAFPGDLVVIAVGSSGHPAIVPSNLPKAILSQNCNKITLDNNIVLNKYILLVMHTDQAKTQLANKTTDTARPFLSLTNLKKTIIPIPPLEEQRRIVAYLDSVQARLASLRELQSATGEELDMLLPSVLDRAFKRRDKSAIRKLKTYFLTRAKS